MGTITNSNNKNNNFDCDDDNIENKKCFYCYKHIVTSIVLNRPFLFRRYSP